MSYQGSEWVRKLRGVNRGEKAILVQIGCHQDQRTNVARVTVQEIARDAGMSERPVTRILQQLEGSREGHPTGILHRIGGGDGRRTWPLTRWLDSSSKTVTLRDWKG